MKKLISTLICLVALSATALPVAAQTRNRNCSNGNGGDRGGRVRYDTRYDSRYDQSVNRARGYSSDAYQNTGYRNDAYNNDVYSSDSYRYGQNRSVWDQHRDKIATAGGAVGGALLGGLIGGKKGAVIGAITGGAGAAIYTYKVRNRNRRY